MKKSVLIWCIVAAVLLVLGAGIGGLGLWLTLEQPDILHDWGFATPGYETHTHVIEEDFSHLSIHTVERDVVLRPSQDGTVRVECRVNPWESCLVEVKDGTLWVDGRMQEKSWRNYSFFSPGRDSQVTLWLPQKEYGTLEVDATSGDVTVTGFACQKGTLTTTTGDLALTDVDWGNFEAATTTGDVCINSFDWDSARISTTTGDVEMASSRQQAGDLSLTTGTGDTAILNGEFASLTSEGTTGDISLTGVTAETSMDICRTTGEVVFVHSDAGEMNVQTSTGDVTGTLLTPKNFSITTTTGDIFAPHDPAGTPCRVATTTGDVALWVE